MFLFLFSFESSENNNDTDDLVDFNGPNIVSTVNKPLPPDGCSLKSQEDNSGYNTSRLPYERKLSQSSQKASSNSITAPSAKPGQPSPPSSSDTRGEVEGSSDNNSPPTSVIQGNINKYGQYIKLSIPFNFTYMANCDW